MGCWLDHRIIKRLTPDSIGKGTVPSAIHVKSNFTPGWKKEECEWQTVPTCVHWNIQARGPPLTAPPHSFVAPSRWSDKSWGWRIDFPCASNLNMEKVLSRCHGKTKVSKFQTTPSYFCKLIEVFFKRNERGFPLIVRWAVRRETRTKCSLSLFVPICAATFCFVFRCGFLLQSKEKSLFLEWKSSIWCKLGREEGWVYLEKRPRTGFLSCFSTPCILSLVLVVCKSLALANLSMSSLKAFPAERKEGRKRQKTQNPKPLRINKNQKNSPNNKRKHPPTKTTSHVTRNLSSKTNPETPKFSNG